MQLISVNIFKTLSEGGGAFCPLPPPPALNDFRENQRMTHTIIVQLSTILRL